MNNTNPLTKKTAVICLSPNRGGMELASLKLTKILSEYINTIVIIQKDKFLHKQCIENEDYSKLTYETIKFKSTFSLSIMLNTRKIIKKYNIKNVIFVGASELKSLYFAFIGLNINLIIRHGTTKSTPKKDWFHKLIYSNVKYHVAISKHLSNNVQKIVPFGKHTQLITIYPSMPKEISTEEKKDNKILKLLHVGRITKGKGLKEALIASEILYKNHIEFSLDSYGEIATNYENEFTSFINNLNYKNSFHLCGFTNNIYDEYQKHDIFIFPTKGEGFGNVVMEAISHGIIILSFDNTSISNFKELGFHIHLADDTSIESLQKKLFHIVSNLKEEKKLALENISKAKSFFSKEREAFEYIQLLKE